MCGNLACLVSVLLGIDAGWQPLPEGGWIYLIQIEPHVVQRLKSGEIEALRSNVPPEVKDVRAYRITVGTFDLPRQISPPTEGDPARVPVTMVRKPSIDSRAVRAGGLDRVELAEAVPLPAGGVEYLIRLRRDALDGLENQAVVVQGEIPPEVENVRAYRITVGQAEVPPSDAPPTAPPSSEAPPSESPPSTEPQAEPSAADPFPPRFGPPPMVDALANNRFGSDPVGRLPQWEASASESFEEPAQTVPPPAPLETGAGEKPIDGRQLAYNEPIGALLPGGSSSPSDQRRVSADALRKTPEEAESDKPWLPLTIALLTLFGSLAGNAYLGWITWDTRGRYRALQRQIEDEPLP